MPLVVMLVLGVVQIVVVVRDQIAIEFAAREGARAASIAAAPSAAAQTAATRATALAPIAVSTTATSRRVSVTVGYTTTSRLPILGLVVGDVELSATVEMAREPP